MGVFSHNGSYLLFREWEPLVDSAVVDYRAGTLRNHLCSHRANSVKPMSHNIVLDEEESEDSPLLLIVFQIHAVPVVLAAYEKRFRLRAECWGVL